MKILHIADEHIRDKDIDEITRCLDFIVETARQEKPDLIVSCGDIFDSNEVKTDSPAARLAIKTISRLADIAPVAIITGTYKHEGNAPEILRYAKGKHDVFVTSYPNQAFLYQGAFYETMVGTTNPDVIVTMIPAITKQFFKTASGIADADQEVAQEMTKLFLGFGAACAEYDAPHVLLWHGGISGAKIPSGHVLTGQEIEISTDQIRLAGANHDFLGAFYPGPIYPVKVDEQECGFWMHELEKRDFLCTMGHIHQPQRIGAEHLDVASRWIATPITKTVRFATDRTDPEAGMFNEVVPAIAGANVRHEIKVYQDEAGDIDKAGMERLYLDAGAASVEIQITRIPRVQVRSESVLAAESLADKLVASAALRGETVTPEVLETAGLLEHTDAESLLKMVMEGAI